MKKLFVVLTVVALAAFSAPSFAGVNPFMDVPANHWAYDAIGQLAARGILSGYPDGSYKGNQPMTRYEAASMTARALASIDADKAEKQDVEMLKRLVVEFKDELDVLGVKVGKLDGRLAVMEERIGGWQLWGEMEFDAEFSEKDDSAGNENLYGTTGKNRFALSKYRIWMRKIVDEHVTFTARIGSEEGEEPMFERYWIDVALPWDFEAMIGRWEYDWAAEDELYIDNDAMFTDRALLGFYFNKPFAMGNFAFYVTRPDEGGVAPDDESEHYEFGVRAKATFNERFWMSLQGIWRKYDANVLSSSGDPKEDEHVYWGVLGVNFTPHIALRGAYYKQETQVGADVEKPAATQVILDIKQDALKFTSVWIEYVAFDDNFSVWTDAPWNMYGTVTSDGNIGEQYENIYFIGLTQDWNDQLNTFQRYFKGKVRGGSSPSTDDTVNWTIGAVYHYTPALSFELAYDRIENSEGVLGRDDNLIRLRTRVEF